jgi:hypothetical protein
MVPLEACLFRKQSPAGCEFQPRHPRRPDSSSGELNALRSVKRPPESARDLRVPCPTYVGDHEGHFLQFVDSDQDRPEILQRWHPLSVTRIVTGAGRTLRHGRRPGKNAGGGMNASADRRAGSQAESQALGGAGPNAVAVKVSIPCRTTWSPMVARDGRELAGGPCRSIPS